MDGAAAGYEVAGVVGGWVVGAAGDAGVVVGSLVGLVPSDGCSLADAEAECEWLSVGVSEAFDAPLLACSDAEEAGVNIAGCVDDGEPVHAETVAETSIVKVAQVTAVSFAPPAVPRLVLRTFMKPP
ncbi:MAG TPA: hypothetical protein VKG80_23270 [Trebonia sp.]|nr:hypothetical protein [Trebonia sp.]